MYISDESDTEFFLEKLSDCSFWDALRILNCKKKMLSERERAFLVFGDKPNFFGKSDFCLQTISLPLNLPKDEVFLMEDVVAEFCVSAGGVGDDGRWLYAADHGSGNRRIITGIGRGIMISRFLPKDANLSEEVSKTVMYLRRFGTDRDIKFFSPSDGLKIPSGAGFEKIVCGVGCDVVKFMRNFARGSRRIRPVAVPEGRFEKFLRFSGIYVAPLIMLAVLLLLEWRISENRESISLLEGSVHAVGKAVKLEITEENLPDAKRIVDVLKESPDPTDLFLKTSEILGKYNAVADSASLEDGKRMRVRTSLDEAALARLKIEGDAEVQVISAGEYEEVGAERKRGVELCVER
jgi:hypothetical protein